jgi:hypothetical protein
VAVRVVESVVGLGLELAQQGKATMVEPAAQRRQTLVLVAAVVPTLLVVTAQRRLPETAEQEKRHQLLVHQ